MKLYPLPQRRVDGPLAVPAVRVVAGVAGGLDGPVRLARNDATADGVGDVPLGFESVCCVGTV